MSSLLHVARNGTPLGQFRKDQVPELLEAGTLQHEDLYYDEGRREWVPLSRFQTTAPLSAKPGADNGGEDEPGEADEASSRRSRGRRRRSGHVPKKPRKRSAAESALPGWIACLFAIAAAAGLWAWAQSLRDQLQVNERKVQELNEDLASFSRQNAILLEMSPPGTMRGVITSEPQPGRLSMLSGVNVGLFRIDDAREAMLAAANLPTPVSEEEFSNIVTEVQRRLPPPIAMTLSDSSGRFDLQVPEDGHYAVVSTAFRQGPGNPQRLFWIVGFESQGEPSPVVALSEKNAISLAEPTLKITPARR
jgi:hypothetical protein